jgi:hypothetical protein
MLICHKDGVVVYKENPHFRLEVYVIDLVKGEARKIEPKKLIKEYDTVYGYASPKEFPWHDKYLIWKRYTPEEYWEVLAAWTLIPLFRNTPKEECWETSNETWKVRLCKGGRAEVTILPKPVKVVKSGGYWEKPYWRVYGDTYPHRDLLKEYGFVWDPVLKEWVNKEISDEEVQKLVEELKRRGARVILEY